MYLLLLHNEPWRLPQTSIVYATLFTEDLGITLNLSQVLNEKHIWHACTCAHTHARTDILTYPAVVEHFAVRAKSFLFTFNIWKCLRFEENIFIKCLML